MLWQWAACSSYTNSLTGTPQPPIRISINDLYQIFDDCNPSPPGNLLLHHPASESKCQDVTKYARLEHPSFSGSLASLAESAWNLTAAHSAVLTACPGAMVGFMPRQHCMAAVSAQPPSQGQAGSSSERQAQPILQGHMPAATGQTLVEKSASVKQEAVVRPSQTEPPVTGISPYKPPVSCMWNRVLAPGNSFGQSSSHAPGLMSPAQRGTAPTMSPVDDRQASPPNMGVFRHTAVSPTSIYNPGITYPLPYGSSRTCYPLWMNYPAMVPVGMAYSGGIPQEVAQGLPRPWPTPPPDGSCIGENTTPWAGQLLAGCTADWVRNPIMQCTPPVTPQHAPPAVSCVTTTSFSVTLAQESPWHEFCGLISPSCEPVKTDVLGPGQSGTSVPEEWSSADTLVDNSTNSADSTSGATGRSAATEQFIPVDFVTLGRVSPITKEYSLSPYSCYPPSRHGTPTKCVVGGSQDVIETSWMSPLNTPEICSQATSQASSRVTSPLPNGGEGSLVRNRQPNEAAGKMSDLDKANLAVEIGIGDNDEEASDDGAARLVQ